MPGTDGYSVFFSIYNTVVAGLLIPILMCVFGLLTVHNVKQVQLRAAQHVNAIHPEVDRRRNSPHAVYKRNYDYQLLFMVLVQTSVYLITTLPFILFSLYGVLSIKWVKSIRHKAIDGVVSSVVYTLVLTNFCATFYIYVLMSSTYRRDLVRQWKRLRFWRRSATQQQHTPVQPIPLKTFDGFTRRIT